MKFISLIPRLNGVDGHVFMYNKHVRSFAIRRFKYSALIAKNNTIPKKLLPKEWEPVLKRVDYSSRNTAKLIILEILSLATLFSEIRKNIKKQDTIFFIESYTVWQLLTISLCFFITQTKNKSYFINIVRYGKSYLGYQYFFFKISQFLFKKKLGINYIEYSDSLGVISESLLLQQNKNECDYLIPIPHTFTLKKIKKRKNEKNIPNVWFPGQLRKDKGIVFCEKILNFAFRSDLNFNLTISNELVSNNFIHKNIHLIPKVLTQKNYENLFELNDFILLPYTGNSYKLSTSGIFVESIFSRKIPLVQESTWMALELKRYNLEELVFDFNNIEIDQFSNNLKHLMFNKAIIPKIKKMSDDYKKFHNYKSFYIFLDNQTKSLLKKKIVFDGRAINQNNGIGNYSKQIILFFLKNINIKNYNLTIISHVKSELSWLPKNYHRYINFTYESNNFLKSFKSLIWLLFFSHRLINKIKPNLFVSLSGIKPLFIHSQTIFVIYDFVYKICRNTMNLYTFFAYFIFFNKGVNSEFLISISKGTNLKLIKYFNVQSDIIIHPKVRDIFYEKLINTDSLDFLNKKKFFLFVGTIEPRKNLFVVLKAFKKILSFYPDILFVIAGNPGWKSNHVIDEINQNKNIIFLHNPSDKKIKFLYSKCHAFVFTSLYEGFGIPPREALALKVKNLIISDLIEIKEGIDHLPNVITVKNNESCIFNAMKKTIINQSINQQSFKYEPINREDLCKFKKYIETI